MSLNMIWKTYETPCVISRFVNRWMISKCSGILNCGQHSFNMIWSGALKVWKTLSRFNIFNLFMISKCSGMVLKWKPYATYESIETSKSLIFRYTKAKNVTLRESNPKHAPWQNGRPDSSKNQKCWYFGRPMQKNDFPKSMHPDNFGLRCNCWKTIRQDTV